MRSFAARAVLVGVLAVLVGAGAASAAPLEANRQGSNNAAEVVYDDVTASLETITDTSAIRIPEKIRMWISLNSDPAAEVGSRLLGELRIYLRGDKAMSFDGIFRLVLLNSDTGERTRIEAADAFVLRPQVGRRSHKVHYVFDMPSGTYLYFATYKPY